MEEHVKKFRLSRVRERFVEAYEKKGHTLGIVQQGGPGSRSQILLKHTWICAYNTWDPQKNIHKVKGTHAQACEQFFRHPNMTTQRESSRFSVRLRT